MLWCQLLPTAFRRNGEGTVFTDVCLSTGGSGTPSPSHNTSMHWSHALSGVPQCLVPCPFPGRLPPIQSRGGIPHPVPDRAVPHPVLMWGGGRGVGTPARSGWGRTGLGVPPLLGLHGGPPKDRAADTLLSGLDGAHPPPPPRARAAERVLATRRVVCLLRHAGGLSCFSNSLLSFRWNFKFNGFVKMLFTFSM